MNIKKTILGCIIVLTTFVSCKKEEITCNCPEPTSQETSEEKLISLVSNSWVIDSYIIETKTNYIDGSSETYELSYINNLLIEEYEKENTSNDTSWFWNGNIIQDKSLELDTNYNVVYKLHYKLSKFIQDENSQATVEIEYYGGKYWADTTISVERIYYKTGNWDVLVDTVDNLLLFWNYFEFEEIYNIKTLYRHESGDEILNPNIEINSTTRKQDREYYYFGEKTDVWHVKSNVENEIILNRVVNRNNSEAIGSSETSNTTIQGTEYYKLLIAD